MARASADRWFSLRLHRNAMTKLRLISTDFDGTLYLADESPPVPEHCQAEIARLQAQGVRWVINTGRDWESLRVALEAAALAVEPDYLVLVEREIFEREERGYRPWEGWNQACREAHDRLFARVRPELPALEAWIHERYRATVYADAFSPFCLIAENNDEADRILGHVHRRLAWHPDLMIMRNDVYARLNHADYTKGTALGEIARRLGVGPEEILAAGDHLNDLPMLTRDQAHHLVAPFNAVPEVKACVRRQGGFVSRWPGGHGLADGLLNHLAVTEIHD